MPDIVHSTLIRWVSEPPDEAAAAAAFAAIAAEWTPLEVEVTCARGVFEDAPYMHIPCDAEHVWWSWGAEQDGTV